MSEKKPAKKADKITARMTSRKRESSNDRNPDQAKVKDGENARAEESAPVSVVRDVRTNPPEDAESKVKKDSQKKETDELSVVVEESSKPPKKKSRKTAENGDKNPRRTRSRGERASRGDDGQKEIQKMDVDVKRLKKLAQKIYRSEVCEEGLSLLDQRALREYARGSFLAARVFLEEEGRIDG